MFNLHLLKLELDVREYQEISIHQYSLHPELFLSRLPAYMVARCPICMEENTERLNTYSMRGWNTSYGKGVFDHRARMHHCSHFVLVQIFFNFHSICPAEAKGTLGPEIPHVIGHLLEGNQCLAVIHALPICRTENGVFVPSYTLFMVVYFSEKPQRAYDSVISFNVPYVEEGIVWMFIRPPRGCENWWDLNDWISRGLLYWVNGDDPKLKIQTHNTTLFPFKNLVGRTEPYFHTFPHHILRIKKGTQGEK